MNKHWCWKLAWLDWLQKKPNKSICVKGQFERNQTRNRLFEASHSEMLLTGQVQPNAKILSSPLANPQYTSRGKRAFSMTAKLLHLARLVYFCKSCLCKKSLLLTKHNKQALALETGLTGLAATNKYIRVKVGRKQQWNESNQESVICGKPRRLASPRPAAESKFSVSC